MHQPRTDSQASAMTTGAPRPQSRALSLVVPVFNEEEVAATFICTIDSVAGDLRDVISAVEVVFVDDGSTDRTLAMIQQAEPLHIAIRIVKLSRNFRKDNALAAGLRYATGDAVIPMDADLQDPPEAIRPMVEAWLGGAKLVNAKRASRAADKRSKRAAASAFYRVFNRLSDVPMDPDVGDFRLLDRQIVDVVNQMPERVRFMKGMLAWIGFTPVTIEYDRPERAGGRTKWSVWKLWNFALDGITGSSTLPLRGWTYFGGLVAVFAILYAAFLIIRTLIYGVDVPGYASLMVVVLIIGAVNLIALGVLGEYIGRLTVETKQRPTYVVDEVIELSADKRPKAEAKEASPDDASPPSP